MAWAVCCAFDDAGHEICIARSDVPQDLAQFIGVHDTGGRIASITLDYGNTTVSENIDDLYFAPYTGHSDAHGASRHTDRDPGDANQHAHQHASAAHQYTDQHAGHTVTHTDEHIHCGQPGDCGALFPGQTVGGAAAHLQARSVNSWH
ncbi:MAG: hypothetical protein R2911_08550 [Caldilineaceae bacterium]